MSDEGTRLNKFLASCGLGSRRACDEFIQTGRVEFNGHACLNPGTKVGPGDYVKVDGKRVVPKTPLVVAFHKPRGFVCSKEDELGRETIYQFLPPALHHLHHVGRLDRDSEGLLILTNDGDLTQQLMHPSKSMEKEYHVTSNQPFENQHLDQFLIGIYTPEGKLKAKSIERQSARRIKIVLEHGAKRQIRVMFEAMGYQVVKLLRVRIGSLWLGDLEPGDSQALNAAEIEMLLKNPKVADSSKRYTHEKIKEKAAQEKALKERGAQGPVKPAAKTAPRGRTSDGTKPYAKAKPMAKPAPAKRGRPKATSRSERTPKRPGSKRHR
jgi:23S rRNA pseudouridine2605 synthase